MNAKKCVKDLALFGGEPAFRELLHVGRPNIGSPKRFLKRAKLMLETRRLTNNGPYVQEFEHSMAKLTGVRYFVAVCNGTVALELAIRALGLKGEVIMPSMTFIASAHALEWQGITPVFCDVNPLTHSIDPRLIGPLITNRTTGIMGVHLWGRPCAVEALSRIAKRHNLGLIFDAGHALACSHQGRMIGSFGNAEAFSFHATKFLNTFEGGGVATNDEKVASQIRLMRDFGFAGEDKVVCLGTNGKMSEVSAAMGLTQIESLDQFIDRNHRNYRRYLEELENLPGVHVFRYDEREKCNYQYVVLEIDEEASLSRDELMEVLRAENVLARRYFYPGCHRMEPYFTSFPDAVKRLPETEKLSRRLLQLPTGTSVSSSEIRRVCHIIRFAIRHASELKRQLAERTPSRLGAVG
jgi:dTDP-4-amino-4,6-dideoxygalactose transaminase